MWEEAFKWLDEHYHGFAILFVGAALSWLLANRYYHWVYRFKKVEIECSKIDDKIIPKLESIDSTVLALSSSFNKLIAYLKGKDHGMDTSLFVSKSPIQLTDLGERILVATGGKSFIDRNIQMLIKEIDTHPIRTAFDVQIFAPIVISEISNSDLFDDIKIYTFNNPYYKERNIEGNEISVLLDMPTIVKIMGIYLRNRYLDQHTIL